MILSAELSALEDSLRSTPEGHRQYVTRLPVPTAALFIRDCIASGEQPADRLRAIVSDYYSGSLVRVARETAVLVEQLSGELGQSPDQVIQGLLFDAVMAQMRVLWKDRKKS